jgi:hypothetical protein
MGNAGNCSLIVVGALTINNGTGHFDNTCTGGGFSGSTLQTVALSQ